MNCKHGLDHIVMNKKGESWCQACRDSASPEYVSTLDRVTEKQKKDWDNLHGKKTPDMKEVMIPEDKLDSIIRAQKYILDKLHSMDRFLRMPHSRNGGHSTYDSEYEKREIIKEFLIKAKRGELSEDDKSLFQNLLTHQK